MNSTKLSQIAKKLSKERFQGCLVGAAIGDCLGAPFEGLHTIEGIERKRIFRELKLNENGELSAINKGNILEYTDDTAMTLSVSLSLLECKELRRVDMASRFCKEYYKEKNRGYGSGVVQVFSSWKQSGITEKDVLNPSQAQFDGSGSYGNGAAMRVAPVGLFTRSIDECIKIAKATAILTHSNKHGYNGAVLQALAIFKALNTDGDIKYLDFLSNLQEEMAKLENCNFQDSSIQFAEFKEKRLSEEKSKGRDEILHNWTRSEHFTFTKQLEVVKELLQRSEENPSENSVAVVLGNIGADISAMQSVPAAIYCFLKNLNKGFEETLYYAISLGYDTDTIASMACAIAGAYYGISHIPKSWIEASEGTNELLKHGERFYNLRN